jgi:nicotinamide riboside kinase
MGGLIFTLKTPKMKTLYIITGKAASGKTRLAQEIASKHGSCLNIGPLSTVAGIKIVIKDQSPDLIILEEYDEDFKGKDDILKLADEMGYRVQYCRTSATRNSDGSGNSFNVEYTPPLSWED